MDEPLAIVLAAGKGTRMNADRPKVLCRACGRPLIAYVLDALDAAGVRQKLVVVGYRAEEVRAALADRPDVAFVRQGEQLGTGHAVAMCRSRLAGRDGPVVVLAGDSPMVQAASLRRLLELYRRERPACVLGTLVSPRPDGLGRIVRDEQGRFRGIVEQKEATPEQLAIREVNMSTYVFDCAKLLGALPRLSNRNNKGEYYLTDCPGLLLADGEDVRALPVLQPCEALSVNTPEELAAVERALREVGGPECAS